MCKKAYLILALLLFVRFAFADLGSVFDAIQKHDTKLLQQELLDQSIDLHGFNDKGQSPLAFAKLVHSKECFKLLLENRVDPDAPVDLRGNSIMAYMGKRSYDFVRILDEYGANLNPVIKTFKGEESYVSRVIKADEAGILLFLHSKGVDIEDKEASLKTALKFDSLRVACAIVELNLLDNGEAIMLSPESIDELNLLSIRTESAMGKYWLNKLNQLLEASETPKAARTESEQP